MTHGGSGRGLRPAVPLACRAWLREAFGRAKPRDDDHGAHCAFCAARLAFRDRQQLLLSSRPDLPRALASPRLLEGVQERVIEAAEAGPIGDLVARSMPLPTASESAWPQPLLQSEVARRTVSPPEPPSPLAWARVRQSILGVVAAGRAPASRRWWLGAAGVAAAAVISGLLIHDRTVGEPDIVFADLEVIPDVEWVIVRHGATR